MKIMCVCGHGLGSSFMIELNVKKVLKKLNLDNEIVVEHGSAMDISKGSADLFICGKDIYKILANHGPCIVMENLISMAELEEKLSNYFKEIGLI